MPALKDKEIVLAENKLEEIKENIRKAEQTLAQIKSEIDRKSSDYNIYIAQRDAESKRVRQETLDQSDQLIKDKQEFQGILQRFQQDKAAFLEQKKTVDNQNSHYEEKMNNIRQFVIAVQRAVSLLGL